MLGHLDVSNLANIYMYVLKTQKPVITWTNSFLSNSVQRSYRMQHEYCQTRTFTGALHDGSPTRSEWHLRRSHGTLGWMLFGALSSSSHATWGVQLINQLNIS